MKYLKSKLGVVGAMAVLLVAAGCLVSGTFVAVVVVVDADFTTQTMFYFYDVDLTDNDIWDEHKDDIKQIETVGFELWITNNEAVARTFSVYLDDPNQPVYNTVNELENNTTLALDGLTLLAGPGVQTHTTYGQSFSLLKNLETIKSLVEGGQLHYYGVSDGGTPAGYTIDSVKIVITFLAGA